jgi:hypothetical protein
VGDSVHNSLAVLRIPGAYELRKEHTPALVGIAYDSMGNLQRFPASAAFVGERGDIPFPRTLALVTY